MKKIERPYWWNDNNFTSPAEQQTLKNLREWFDTHIEPHNKLIEGAVEVWSPNNGSGWHDNLVDGVSTHRAYLIGIQSIKKETAEDVLRDFKNEMSKWNESTPQLHELYKRAKAVLGEIE